MLETSAPAVPFSLACPACRTSLDDTGHCTGCTASYPRVDGIWRFLDETRAHALAQFEQEYHTVRRDEGWGSNDAAYYRGLPWRDSTGRFEELWRVRATSFRTLLHHLGTEPRTVLDLGAGNCWLSYQLAKLGHLVAAIDIQVDPHDGLGAWQHYDAAVTPIQAEFDRLPVADGEADVVVFNGALHYSTSYATTLREALRVLRPGGTIAILDSPMYASEASGTAMVDERRQRFLRSYGFTSDALANEHYLTPARLDALSAQLDIHWRVLNPWRGWRWALRPWLAAVRGGRAPATFPVILGTLA